MTTTHSRETLERWAQRLDATLAPADRQTRMDAASQGEPVPRWQLESSTTGQRSDVRGYQTLAEVGDALEHRGITMDRQDAAPATKPSPAQDWAPPVDGGKALGERMHGPAQANVPRRERSACLAQ